MALRYSYIILHRQCVDIIQMKFEYFVLICLKNMYKHNTIIFIYLADTFIQSDLQMRTIEAIKMNKRIIICECYNKSQLA